MTLTGDTMSSVARDVAAGAVFLPFPLSASSLRCACVVRSLSLLAQVVQSVEKHTLVKGVVTSCLFFDL